MFCLPWRAHTMRERTTPMRHLAIATAKEFLETVCKTILSERGIQYDKAGDLPKLVKLKELQLMPDDLPAAAQGTESVRVLLQNLAAIGQLPKCRRFRSGKSLPNPQTSTKLNRATPTRSIESSYFLQISTDFKKRKNLVRDQEVGGSNPLAPTILFNVIEPCRSVDSPYGPCGSLVLFSVLPDGAKSLHLEGDLP